MTRFLILNADDFGYSARVNAAVRKAHCEGVLTSASLMVAEEGFGEAVAIARENPRLGVGLHLVVTLDKAVLPAKSLPHIVNTEGRFGADPLKVGLQYAFSRAAQRELREEIGAQFERFAQTGLPHSHVDGHQHFHLPPTVWDALVEESIRHAFHRFRIPHEPIRPHLRTGGKGPDLDSAATLVFRLLRRRNLRVLRRRAAELAQPFFTCEHVYGHLQTGQMNTNYVLQLIERLEGDCAEIYFHPGAPHATTLPPEQRTNGIEDVELQALLSPAVRVALETRNLTLGSYAEIERHLRA